MWELPYMLFRGGTSKGPFFMRVTIPSEAQLRDKILLDVMGSPHQIQVDGIGGGHALANKVCIVGASKRHGIDVDYLLCQVHVNKPLVETSIDCGNMLAAVAPYAIETGLVKTSSPETKVKIYSENTGVIIEAVMQTPNGRILYAGETKIDGVERSGSPIKLSFLNPVGSYTKKMLPTEKLIDLIDNIEVTCVDVSMPMIIVAAQAFGKTGHESKTELDADKTLMNKLEDIRKKAAILMGMGDVSGRTSPKICMVAAPKDKGNIAARYLIAPFEYDCHPSFAVTGAMCLAASCYIKNSVPHRYAKLSGDINQVNKEPVVSIEHPCGMIEASVQFGEAQEILKVSYVRTARLLSKGETYIPGEAPNELKNIIKAQAFARGFFARKNYKKEMLRIKNEVLKNYAETAWQLHEQGKSDEAKWLTSCVEHGKFIDAYKYLSKRRNQNEYDYRHHRNKL